MRSVSTSPVLSVVIPTHNRAALLHDALVSLSRQSLPTSQFEVIVVDDGSTDHTADLCRSFHSRLDLHYFRTAKSGISAAKNLGIFAARGALILFFDDDDLADEDLLREHVRAHQRHPEEHLAVLGYTTWAPSLPITEVMRYITDIGGFWFDYRYLKDGRILGYEKFWGGRTSCKRSLLIASGVFDPSLPGAEDDELGYRLSRVGLQVLYQRSAVSYMNRPITYDGFSRRCLFQGGCRALVYRRHPESPFRERYGVPTALETWEIRGPALPSDIAQVPGLEAALSAETDPTAREKTRRRLHELYCSTFNALLLRGLIEALGMMPVETATVD